MAIAAMDVDSDGRISRKEFEEAAALDSMQDLLATINLPKGFGFGELFTMLDNDGGGWLSQDEIIDGVQSLLYSTDFHRDCITAYNFGNLKQSFVVNHEEMKKFTAEVMADIHAELTRISEITHTEIENVRSDISSMRAGTQPTGQQNFADIARQNFANAKEP